MRKFLVGCFVSVWVLGCRSSVEKPLAARYKDKYLTREEVLQRVIVSPGGETLSAIRGYAMQWVRQQALAETAYALLPALRPQIEAQVQEYRNKLLILYLSRLLLEEASYGEVSDSAMRAFYQEQAQAFRAVEPLYRWRWVQVPATWAAQLEVRQNFSLSDSAWLEWIAKRQYRGGVQATWTARLDSLQPYFLVRLSDLPMGGTAQVQRIEQNQPHWLFFQLTGKILAGQILPYELAKDQIRRILIQQASEARLDSFQQAVYQRVLSNPEVRVF